MTHKRTTPSPSPTTAIVRLDTLSRIADRLRDLVENPPPGGKAPNKNTILNIMAAEICGPKHNWGYMVNHAGPVRDKRLAADEDTTHAQAIKTARQEAQDAIGALIETVRADSSTQNPTPPKTAVNAAQDALLRAAIHDAFVFLCEADTQVVETIDGMTDTALAEAVEAATDMCLSDTSLRRMIDRAYAEKAALGVVNAIVDYGYSALLSYLQKVKEAH